MNQTLNAVDIANIARRRKLQTFCLELTGDSLSPQYNAGDLLIVDTEATPEAGNAIITEVDGQTVAMLLNGDLDAFDHRGGYVERGAFFIIGVVVDTEGERLPAVQ